jgi:hypothetical protein
MLSARHNIENIHVNSELGNNKGFLLTVQWHRKCKSKVDLIPITIGVALVMNNSTLTLHSRPHHGQVTEIAITKEPLQSSTK